METMAQVKSVEDYLNPHLDTLNQLYHREAVRDHSYSSNTCTASVLQAEGTEDIGGDMNHVHKMGIAVDCVGIKQAFSVVVKRAPTQVLVRMLLYTCVPVCSVCL